MYTVLWKGHVVNIYRIESLRAGMEDLLMLKIRMYLKPYQKRNHIYSKHPVYTGGMPQEVILNFNQ